MKMSKRGWNNKKRGNERNESKWEWIEKMVEKRDNESKENKWVSRELLRVKRENESKQS